jgi:hypothetical protein
MNFNDQDIAAIQTLGYTLDEARFLYLVAAHSGYFVPRQFLAFSGAKSGKRSSKLTAKLESRGHVTWREYDRTGGVYHLFSKTIYRRIGRENLGNRRRHSVGFIRTRLVLFDFILANLGFDYLETEPEKVDFFCHSLGLSKEVLPARTYEGGARSQPTLRYFVDRFPLFVEDKDSAAPVVTFTYVDPGQTSLAAFANHLRAYLPLLGQLEAFSFLYLANSPAHFLRAEQCFSRLVGTPLEVGASSEILRYFQLRHAWELKKYGSLSASDVEWLKEATRRFHGHRFDCSYLAWASGTLTEPALEAELRRLRPERRAQFRTCLVIPAPPRRGNPVENGQSAFHPFPQDRTAEEDTRMAVGKGPPESVTRSLSLEKPVSELLDDYSRFVDSPPDCVANIALKKTLSCDPEYKEWKAGGSGVSTARPDQGDR